MTDRAGVLAAYGANPGEIDELLAYHGATFDLSVLERPVELPLADEAFVATWDAYAAEAARDGAYATLQRHIPRLRFPICEGISASAPYRAATLRGESTVDMPEATGLKLNDPDRVALYVHETAAGRIPIIVAGSRGDFVALVQALSAKNEPVPVPPSMGATMVSGFNNWERVQAHRTQWGSRTSDASKAAWAEEFSRLVPRRELYQDRFIVLQQGYYSAVAAGDIGMAEDAWRDLSLTIRREHECTHYFTLRLFGAMNNALIDELMADYAGIVAATGGYRADWFLRFLGLEAYPAYREGGRLQNYRGKPPLSDGAFRVLQQLARRAALAVEEFDAKHAVERATPEGRARVLLTLASHTIDALAARQAQKTHEEAWSRTAVSWASRAAIAGAGT